MRICLINLSIRPDAKSHILPNGFAYVATAVKRAGIAFDLIDMDINHYSCDDLRKIIAENGGYDVFAFGCIVSGFRYARDVAATLREIAPECTIIAGNSIADAAYELTLRRTEVDICSLGEGDDSLPELLSCLAHNGALEAVRGIAFLNKENGELVVTEARPYRANMDSYGFPDWDMFDVEAYSKSFKVSTSSEEEEKTVRPFPMNTARGCPFHCTFCYIVVRNASVRYRSYSEEAIAQEIIRLHDQYGATHLEFWDDYSFPSRAKLIERLETFEKLPFSITWNAVVRAGLFRKGDAALIQRLAAANCRALSFSLENADPNILAAINKKIDVADFVDQCIVLRENGVVPYTSVIFGYPQETEASIRKTLRVCEEAGVFPSAGYLLPLPGTPIYQWCKEAGKITDDFEYLMKIGDRQDFHINLTEMPDDVLCGEVENGMRNLAVKFGLELSSVMKTVVYKNSKK